MLALYQFHLWKDTGSRAQFNRFGTSALKCGLQSSGKHAPECNFRCGMCAVKNSLSTFGILAPDHGCVLVGECSTLVQ